MPQHRKILFSWLDHRLDLVAENQGRLNKEGPNFQFHQNHFAEGGYTEHVLITWRSEAADKRLIDTALSLFKAQFPKHNIIPQFANIEDPIDLVEVKAATEAILMGYPRDACDLFINPGYQMMQLSWFICHESLGMNTRLLQVRQARYTELGKPKVEEIKMEKSAQAYSMMLQRRSFSQTVPSGIAGICPLDSVLKVYKRARHIAQADSYPALITGATGTGKERLATYLHEQDPVRGSKKDTLFKVNCAAFTDELLLSELFGHKKGAFTGATADKEGYFEKADKGTLFLDEIGDISPFMQQSLLRVLQDGTFQRVGDTKMRHTDVRIIAATNKDLAKMAHEGNFREDLYYRISVARLQLPSWDTLPQTERKQLLDFMMKEKSRESGAKKSLSLSPEARDFLLGFHFKGNIRQLENLIRRLYIFFKGGTPLNIADLQSEMQDELREPFTASSSLQWREVEKAHIEKVLRLNKGNLTHTFQAIGYGSVNTLKKKIKEYNINN